MREVFDSLREEATIKGRRESKGKIEGMRQRRDKEKICHPLDMGPGTFCKLLAGHSPPGPSHQHSLGARGPWSYRADANTHMWEARSASTHVLLSSPGCFPEEKAKFCVAGSGKGHEVGYLPLRYQAADTHLLLFLFSGSSDFGQSLPHCGLHLLPIPTPSCYAAAT